MLSRQSSGSAATGDAHAPLSKSTAFRPGQALGVGDLHEGGGKGGKLAKGKANKVDAQLQVGKKRLRHAASAADEDAAAAACSANGLTLLMGGRTFSEGLDLNSLIVKGTCTDIDKPYFRLIVVRAAGW